MAGENATKPILAIASDHAGLDLKNVLRQRLIDDGYDVNDLGAHDKASVDYPDFANALAASLRAGDADRGVLVCGSGIGISIAANRHPEVRAALCHDALTARLARQHNDANVLALGARVIGEETAKDCLDVFLTTDFEAGRHTQRVEKLGDVAQICKTRD